MKIHDLQRWLHERLPADLLADAPEISVYDDEIVIVLPINADPYPAAAEHDPEAQRQAVLDQIAQRREETRAHRIRLAREIQKSFGLPVAWGMRQGQIRVLFTSRTVPVMTRLGRSERDVLDTLVAAGVAETRSAALAYVVRAFAIEHADWLVEVRQVIEQVEQVRARLTLQHRPGPPRPDVIDES